MKKHRSAFILEKLEPRLLLSADLALLPVDGSFLPADQDVVLVAPAQLSGDSEQVAETAEQVQHEVIFIDARVEDYQQLLDDIQAQKEEGRQFETVLLDSNTDGITQISNYLSSQQNISAVHIISHGSNGEVVLGDSPLNLSTLDGYAESIEGWQQALTDQADLLFYGCNLASGTEGQTLVSSLALLTNADVAASDDATGQAALGGDWELEYARGKIDAAVAVSQHVQQDWAHQLFDSKPEFLVNTSTGGTQETSAQTLGSKNAVAMDSAGNYVVVWTDSVSDLSSYGIFAQRFDATGTKQGVEFQINQTNTDNQYWASVAMADNGTFTVTWTSVIQDGTPSSIYARQFNADGTPASNEFLVNSTNSGSQSNSAIAMNGSGAFVIVWQGNGSDDSDGIFGQYYDASGNALGGEFRVNNTTGGLQENPAVAINSSGAFSVAWESNENIYLEYFDSSRIKQNIEAKINQDSIPFFFTVDDSIRPAIVLDDSGVSSIVWRSENNVADGIYLRQLDSTGTKLGADSTEVSTSGNPDSTSPSISLDSNGNFLITFEKTGDGDLLGTYARSYDASLTALTGETLINQTTSGSQHLVSAALYNIDNYVVVWSGNGSGDVDGVYARQFSTGNTIPSADAGTASTINEGDSLVLDGSGSSDSDGDTLSYAWDLDNDGNYDDAIGVTPAIDWATLQALGVDDDGSYTIGLEVDDGQGGTDTATTTLTINNTAPTLSVTGAATVADGATYTLNLSATDPGNDTITSWTINWGDGKIETIAGNPPTATHTYTNAGFTNNILVSATDEDNPSNYIHSDLFSGHYTNNAGIYRIQGHWGNAPTEFATEGTLDKTIQPIIGPDGNIYVSGESSKNVLRYNATTGAFIDEFVTIPGDAGGIAFGPDGNLYVADYSNQEILQFDGNDGSLLGTFVTEIGGDPYGITFGPDGNLYVNTYNNAKIYKYDGATGASLGVFSSAGAGGLGTPEQMVFGPDGNLYVADITNSSVIRFDGADGTPLGDFIPGTEPHLNDPSGLVFGPDGNLYVSDSQHGTILRFDGTDGTFIDEYASGLNNPSFLAFAPDAQVLVQATNSAPVAVDDSFTVNEGSTTNLDLAANDADADGNLDLNSITIISDPTNGSIDSINGDGTVNYTHDGSETLTDSFTYTIDDLAAATSNTVTVSLTITPMNDNNPVADDETFTVLEGGTASEADLDDGTSLLDGDTDLDTGDTLTVNTTPVVNVSHGTLTLNSDGTFSYTHDGSENFSDSFTYEVSDSASNTDTATVTINITPVNDNDPVADDESFTVLEGGTANEADLDAGISLLDGDTDTDLPNDTLTVNITPISAPTYGTLTLQSDGRFTYTHDGSENFSDSFTYELLDADSGVTDVGTVTITITPVNDNEQMVSTNTGITVDEGSADNVITVAMLETTDIDTTPVNLLYTLTGSPSNGVLYLNTTALNSSDTFTQDDINNGRISFDHDNSENMSDSFTFSVDDGAGVVSTGTFIVTVNPVNDNDPVADNESFTVIEGGTATHADLDAGTSLLDGDTDIDLPNDTLSINTTPASSPSYGLLTLNADGSFSYTHDGSENFSDSFSYELLDANGGTTSIGTVTITITPVNDAPVAVTDSFTVNEGSTANLNLAGNDTDAEGGLDINSITIISDPGHGTIDAINSDGTVDYTHDGLETLSDSFTYTIDDLTGATSNPVTVNLTITPINDAPVLTAVGNKNVDEQTTLTFTATATDADLPGDTLTYSLDASSLTAGMTIDVNTGAFSWTPDEGQNGSHFVTITVTDDGSGNLSDSETFTISVNEINTAPTVANLIPDQVAAEDSVFTFQFAANTFNDADLPANTLTYSSDASGWLTFDAATRTFSGTPLNGDVGTTTVTVTADDGNGGTISDTFDIVVNNVNDAPTITSTANIAATEDSLYSYTLTVNDVDAGDTLTLSAPTLPAWLNFNTTTGVLSGTPTNGDVGDHAVVLRVNDGTVDVDQSFTITVTNVNNAPTAISLDNLNVDESSAGAIVGNLNTTDVDAEDTHTYTVDDVRFEIVADQLKLQAGQSLDHGVEPTVDVTITSTDAGGLNTSQLFTLTVNATNLEPTAVNDNLSAVEDNTLTITSLTDLLDNDSDPDGDTISMAAFTQPTHGTLVDHGDGTLTYTPDHNFSHTDSFDYTISDGHGGTANGTAFIYVAPVGDTPQVADAVVLAGSQSAPIMISRNAADGAEVTHFRISAINGGTLFLTDGVTRVNNGDYISVAQGQAGLRFTPADDAVEGSFQVESSADGVTVAGQSGRATSTIRVTALPLAATPEVELTPQIAAGVEEVVEGETAADEVVESVATAIEAPVETQLPVKEVISADFETGHNRSRNSLSNPILSFIQNGAAANENDESLDAGQRSTQQPLNVLLETTPVETLKNVWGSLDIGTLSVRDYDRVRNSFDALQQEVNQEDRIETAVVSSAIATTMGLSAGYVVWMLKGGSLLASVLSSMPAWHLADPLSILSGMQRDDDDDDESLESILKDSESDEDETEQDKEH